ncbi:MAG TPA: hypothetical protein VLE99_03335 [Candidatus Saccharimonadales bacterium]|nr:hypothetical protein [Candidatus Saccharimonadales bacterium]
MNRKKVLILIHEKSKKPIDPNWELFRDGLAKRMDAEIVMGTLRGLVFEASANGIKVYDPVLGFSLEDFNLVVFRIIRSNWARVSACCSLLKQKGIPYIDTQYEPRPLSKYASEFIRYTSGLPIIHTVFSSNERLAELFSSPTPPIAFPVIVKDMNGRKGRLNFLAQTADELRRILIEHPDVEFVVQEFIPNDGDYRCVVMGGDIKLIVRRQAKSGSHLNNTSQGASFEQVDVASLGEPVVRDVLRAAEIEGVQVAGVDLMFDRRSGQHHILEVNSSPQLLTGAFPDLKMQAYADYLTELLV